jgi:phytoene dehydrogenase-like protein
VPTRQPGKIIIVGAGIAGLCAAIYARRCGYDVDILEKHESAGGLATSWHRGGYTFETCLHWLVGSRPDGALHADWREVFDIERLTFVDPEEFARVETERGECLSIFTNVDRMEAELLRQAPQDAQEVRDFASAVRRLTLFPLRDLRKPQPRNWLALLRAIPYLPLLRRWSRLRVQAYSERFTHPLLKRFIAGGDLGGLSALALLFSLAWMSERNAGYPIGGSRAVIGPLVERLAQLSGRLRLAAAVEKILVEGDAAVGVQLTGGETMTADWVISAADGHATIYDLLGGAYKHATTDKTYATLETFPSYLQVSLGVAKDLSPLAGHIIRVLDAPMFVDPGTSLSHLMFRVFHFDPTFAPRGKTAVTCFLPTRNFQHWINLRQHEPARYQAEKQRIAERVICILEKMVADLRDAIEVVDVSTPATVIRYTGNWKGSMEGWVLSPPVGLRPLPRTLPKLRRFMMVGQWVQPGGGLPSGLLTARAAIQAICKHDRLPFLAQDLSSRPGQAAAEAVG